MLDARVTGLFVNEQTYIAEIDEERKPRAEQALSEIERRASEAGIAHNCVAVVDQTKQDGIVNFAEKHGCDLIVMGTHGRSKVGKLMLGSIAASVLADCSIPVLLYR